MKIGVAIRQATQSEGELADALLRIGERHRVDHDVYHLTRTLARKSRQGLELLEPFADRYDTSVDADHGEPSEGLRATLREKSSELLGNRPAAGALLLRDLRELHLLAAAASIDWVSLAQGAQAAKDQDLVAAVTQCHATTLRILQWTTTRIEQTAPQILTS